MKSNLQRYWLSYLLVVIGLISISLGFASATIWRPASQVTLNLPTAKATAEKKPSLVVTQPGLLGLYDTPAKIKVTGPGAIKAGIANGNDLLGIFSQQPFTKITGQKDETTFLTQDYQPKADQAPQPVALPASVADIQVWNQDSPSGPIQTTWKKNTESDWSLYVFSEAGPAKVEITWSRPVSTPWKWPLIAIGLIMVGLAFAIAVFVWGMERAAKKEAAEYERRRAEKAAQSEALPVVAAPSITSVTKAPTRSQLREARARGEETVTVDGVKFPTGLTQIIKLDENNQPIKPQTEDEADQNAETLIINSESEAESQVVVTETKTVSEAALAVENASEDISTKESMESEKNQELGSSGVEDELLDDQQSMVNQAPVNQNHLETLAQPIEESQTEEEVFSNNLINEPEESLATDGNNEDADREESNRASNIASEPEENR